MGVSSSLKLRKYLAAHPEPTHVRILHTHELSSPSYPDLSCVDTNAQDPPTFHEDHVPVTTHTWAHAHSHTHVNMCTQSATAHTWSLQCSVCVCTCTNTDVSTGG